MQFSKHFTKSSVFVCGRACVSVLACVRLSIGDSLVCTQSKDLLFHTKCNLPAIWTDTTIYRVTVSLWSTRHTVSQRQARRNQQAGVKPSTDGKALVLAEHFSMAFSQKMEKAISHGSIWSVRSRPKLIECQSKRMRNTCESGLILVQWWSRLVSTYLTLQFLQRI